MQYLSLFLKVFQYCRKSLQRRTPSSKMTCRHRPKASQMLPRASQAAPKSVARGLKSAARDSKRLQDSPKRSPQSLKDLPLSHPDLPKGSQETPRGLQDTPRGSSERSRALQSFQEVRNRYQETVTLASLLISLLSSYFLILLSSNPSRGWRQGRSPLDPPPTLVVGRGVLDHFRKHSCESVVHPPQALPLPQAQTTP